MSKKDKDIEQPGESPGVLNLPFVESLYADYLRDPKSVAVRWRRYFSGIKESNGFASCPRLGPSFSPRSLYGRPTPRAEYAADPILEGRPAAARAPSPVTAPRAERLPRAEALIRSHRARGHLIARIDPFGVPRPVPPELEPSFYGFSDQDFDRPVAETVGELKGATLRQVLERLRATYCGPVGIQFMHIDSLEIREWIQERLERVGSAYPTTLAQERRMLTWLTEAAVFEDFLQKKYLGSKSFSVEGSEILVPALDLLIESAAEMGVGEIVIGMAHRGRLNVLANVMKKPARQILREFEDADPDLYMARGDVKYHLGHSHDRITASGRSIHLSLCFNPSHLEFVDPVAIGRMRAKQDRVGPTGRDRGFVVLIHGDAALAGEGVVQEVLNMSGLEGYSTGGTVHVVVNNQIGFTTLPEEGRSTPYATDIAKMLQVPIIHVNGEEPAAVAHATILALEFRQRFHRDVVLDIMAYRRHGHNETDEPAFTQPQLYRAIARRAPVHKLYRDALIAAGRMTAEDADEIARRVRDRLEDELLHAKDRATPTHLEPPGGLWKTYFGGPDGQVPEVDTSVERSRLAALLERQTILPPDFRPHPKIVRGLNQRREMARGQRPLDWSAAEALAIASLAAEGVRVRLSGQDSARATFSQRHAVLHDVENGHTYVPLRHVDDAQAPVEIINSPLSEMGVIGFEYGYSLEWPDGLILWEAQFGDFVNVGQVYVDQFLSSGEEKWRRLSGLVLLLPHGYEGMGSEHSSARLERFLNIAAQDNIQVVNPSTPAQYFHCLRRQVLRHWRKPLVVMTPKSLLRHPEAVSQLSDLSSGRFERVMGDDDATPKRTRRVLLCSGKIYYELVAKRRSIESHDTAILRIEQLYPLSDPTMAGLLRPYSSDAVVRWVQEEPENMGAWRHLRIRFGERLLGRFAWDVVSRPASAAAASGAHSSHKLEQERLLAAAFDVA